MNDSPLVQTFRTLSRPDRSALRKFVNSPFFNQRQDVVRLFEFLCQNVPIGERPPRDASVLSKENAFPHVFPPENAPAKNAAPRAFDDNLMRYAMSFLNGAIKQFLAFQHWSENGTDVGRHLCKALRRRGLEHIFEKEYAALHERAQREPHQSVDYHFQQYQLRLEYWEVFRRSDRADAGSLQAAGESFGAFVAASVLRQASAMLTRPGEKDLAESLAWLPETLAAVAEGKFAGEAAVQVYYHCYRMLTEQGESAEGHFRQLRHWLETHWQRFPPNEIRDVYVLAINFCIRRQNTGAMAYTREAFTLYRDGLERKIILEDGLLNRYTYNNILLLAVGLGEWDWADAFLETHRDSLPPRERDSAYRYNRAIYFFRKNDLGRALEILRHVEFRDVFYNLSARRMLVRAYFDTGESAALDSALESFTIYLRRKKAKLGYHHELNFNFVRYLKSALNLVPGEQAAAQRLRDKVAAAKYVAEREWLLGKIR